MYHFIKNKRCSWLRRFLSTILAFVFLSTSIVPPSWAQFIPQTVLNLPVPGTMLPVSQGFTPTMITGITLDNENPMEFDFIVNTGDTNLQGEALKLESERLIKYFLAALTVPENEIWVNLSPYERDRVIPESFAQTEMGRDLLAQDYLLKQLSASMMYPEDELGKAFWDRVYEKAQRLYGTTDIPMNTFNKIWIVPDKAYLYFDGKTAYVLDSRLNVMLEEDYMALEQNKNNARFGTDQMVEEDVEVVSGVTSEIIREVLIPEIEKEINQGETFAKLRQIYNSMILATWYRNNLKETLLGQIYVDQGKTKGVDLTDKTIHEKIYNQYLEALKRGVYDYIREDYDPLTQEIIPRKFFSGGATTVRSDDVIVFKRKKDVPKSLWNQVKRVEASSGVEWHVRARLLTLGPRADTDAAASRDLKAHSWLKEVIEKNDITAGERPQSLLDAQNAKRKTVIVKTEFAEMDKGLAEQAIGSFLTQINGAFAEEKPSVTEQEFEIILAVRKGQISDFANFLKQYQNIPQGVIKLALYHSNQLSYEVDVDFLGKHGVEHVVLGSRKQRTTKDTTSAAVNLQAIKYLQAGIKPVINIGWTEEEAPDELRFSHAINQLSESTWGILKSDMENNVILTFDPGTDYGYAINQDAANAYQLLMRGNILNRYGRSTASNVPIAFGGLISFSTVSQYSSQPNIDGFISQKTDEISGFLLTSIMEKVFDQDKIARIEIPEAGAGNTVPQPKDTFEEAIRAYLIKNRGREVFSSEIAEQIFLQGDYDFNDEDRVKSKLSSVILEKHIKTHDFTSHTVKVPSDYGIKDGINEQVLNGAEDAFKQLGFSEDIIDTLIGFGIFSLEDLLEWTEEELSELRNHGDSDWVLQDSEVKLIKEKLAALDAGLKPMRGNDFYLQLGLTPKEQRAFRQAGIFSQEDMEKLTLKELKFELRDISDTVIEQIVNTNFAAIGGRLATNDFEQVVAELKSLKVDRLDESYIMLGRREQINDGPATRVVEKIYYLDEIEITEKGINLPADDLVITKENFVKATVKRNDFVQDDLRKQLQAMQRMLKELRVLEPSVTPTTQDPPPFILSFWYYNSQKDRAIKDRSNRSRVPTDYLPHLLVQEFLTYLQQIDEPLYEKIKYTEIPITRTLEPGASETVLRYMGIRYKEGKAQDEEQKRYMDAVYGYAQEWLIAREASLRMFLDSGQDINPEPPVKASRLHGTNASFPEYYQERLGLAEVIVASDGTSVLDAEQLKRLAQDDPKIIVNIDGTVEFVPQEDAAEVDYSPERLAKMDKFGHVHVGVHAVPTLSKGIASYVHSDAVGTMLLDLINSDTGRTFLEKRRDVLKALSLVDGEVLDQDLAGAQHLPFHHAAQLSNFSTAITKNRDIREEKDKKNKNHVIGVLKDGKNGTVALIPSKVAEILAQKPNAKVIVEKDAGLASGYTDQEYIDAGATILAKPISVVRQATILLTTGGEVLKKKDVYSNVQEGQIIIGPTNRTLAQDTTVHDERKLFTHIRERKVTVLDNNFLINQDEVAMIAETDFDNAFWATLLGIMLRNNEHEYRSLVDDNGFIEEEIIHNLFRRLIMIARDNYENNEKYILPSYRIGEHMLWSSGIVNSPARNVAVLGADPFIGREATRAALLAGTPQVSLVEERDPLRRFEALRDLGMIERESIEFDFPPTNQIEVDEVYALVRALVHDYLRLHAPKGQLVYFWDVAAALKLTDGDVVQSAMYDLLEGQKHPEHGYFFVPQYYGQETIISEGPYQQTLSESIDVLAIDAELKESFKEAGIETIGDLALFSQEDLGEIFLLFDEKLQPLVDLMNANKTPLADRKSFELEKLVDRSTGTIKMGPVLALFRAGIYTLDQFAQLSEDDIYRIIPVEEDADFAKKAIENKILTTSKRFIRGDQLDEGKQQEAYVEFKDLNLTILVRKDVFAEKKFGVTPTQIVVFEKQEDQSLRYIGGRVLGRLAQERPATIAQRIAQIVHAENATGEFDISSIGNVIEQTLNIEGKKKLKYDDEVIGSYLIGEEYELNLTTSRYNIIESTKLWDAGTVSEDEEVEQHAHAFLNKIYSTFLATTFPLPVYMNQSIKILDDTWFGQREHFGFKVKGRVIQSKAVSKGAKAIVTFETIIEDYQGNQIAIGEATVMVGLTIPQSQKLGAQEKVEVKKADPEALEEETNDVILQAIDEIIPEEDVVADAVRIQDVHINKMARVSGDHSGIHVSKKAAAESKFKLRDRIAHGQLVADMINTYMRKHGWSKHFKISEQNLNFTAMVFINDDLALNFKNRKVFKDPTSDDFVLVELDTVITKPPEGEDETEPVEVVTGSIRLRIAKTELDVIRERQAVNSSTTPIAVQAVAPTRFDEIAQIIQERQLFEAIRHYFAGHDKDTLPSGFIHFYLRNLDRYPSMDDADRGSLKDIHSILEFGYKVASVEEDDVKTGIDPLNEEDVRLVVDLFRLREASQMMLGEYRGFDDQTIHASTGFISNPKFTLTLAKHRFSTKTSDSGKVVVGIVFPKKGKATHANANDRVEIEIYRPRNEIATDLEEAILRFIDEEHRSDIRENDSGAMTRILIGISDRFNMNENIELARRPHIQGLTRGDGANSTLERELSNHPYTLKVTKDVLSIAPGLTKARFEFIGEDGSTLLDREFSILRPLAETAEELLRTIVYQLVPEIRMKRYLGFETLVELVPAIEEYLNIPQVLSNVNYMTYVDRHLLETSGNKQNILIEKLVGQREEVTTSVRLTLLGESGAEEVLIIQRPNSETAAEFAKEITRAANAAFDLKEFLLGRSVLSQDTIYGWEINREADLTARIGSIQLGRLHSIRQKILFDADETAIVDARRLFHETSEQEVLLTWLRQFSNTELGSLVHKSILVELFLVNVVGKEVRVNSFGGDKELLRNRLAELGIEETGGKINVPANLSFDNFGNGGTVGAASGSDVDRDAVVDRRVELEAILDDRSIEATLDVLTNVYLPSHLLELYQDHLAAIQTKEEDLPKILWEIHSVLEYGVTRQTLSRRNPTGIRHENAEEIARIIEILKVREAHQAVYGSSDDRAESWKRVSFFPERDSELSIDARKDYVPSLHGVGKTFVEFNITQERQIKIELLRPISEHPADTTRLVFTALVDLDIDLTDSAVDAELLTNELLPLLNVEASEDDLVDYDQWRNGLSLQPYLGVQAKDGDKQVHEDYLGSDMLDLYVQKDVLGFAPGLTQVHVQLYRPGKIYFGEAIVLYRPIAEPVEKTWQVVRDRLVNADFSNGVENLLRGVDIWASHDVRYDQIVDHAVVDVEDKPATVIVERIPSFPAITRITSTRVTLVVQGLDEPISVLLERDYREGATAFAKHVAFKLQTGNFDFDDLEGLEAKLRAGFFAEFNLAYLDVIGEVKGDGDIQNNLTKLEYETLEGLRRKILIENDESAINDVLVYMRSLHAQPELRTAFLAWLKRFSMYPLGSEVAGAMITENYLINNAGKPRVDFATAMQAIPIAPGVVMRHMKRVGLDNEPGIGAPAGYGTDLGGIDLNPNLLDMQIIYDNRGIPLPMNQQPISTMQIEGVIPVIINMTPINVPMLLGFVDQDESPTEVGHYDMDPADRKARIDFEQRDQISYLN